MYPVGSFRYTSKEALKYNNIDYLNAIKSRHSVREFSDKKISKDDIKYCVEAAIASPSACNRQMCKVYQVSSHENIELLSNVIMGLGGFEKKELITLYLHMILQLFPFTGREIKDILILDYLQ